MGTRRLTVEIVGDASSLERAFGSAGGAAGKLEEKHRGLNTATKVAAGGFLALGLAAKVGFDEFNEGQKVGAQTAAVLKSTGQAAGVTQKGVEGLAQAVSDYSGIDDEAVQAGENMLLTFTNIHNEVGRGNDIFDQATRTVADMSVALGQDMNTSAIQLGKALNDPIKGVSALQRVGVTFTDQQKEQIKTLVKSGDVMGAQKVILAELNREFGGSAKAAGDTFGGQLNKARNALEGFAGELVADAIPALRVIAGALGKATAFMSDHKKATEIALGVVAGLAAGVLVLRGAMAVAAAATTVWTAVQWALNAALLANPIGIVVVALAALGVALAVAWQKSETFRNIVKSTWDTVKSVAQSVFGFVGPFINATFGSILSTARGFFNIFKGVWDVFAGVFTGDWRRAWDGVKSIASGALNALPGVVRGLLGAVGRAAIELGERIVNGLGAGLSSLASRLVGWIKAPINAVIGAVNSVTGRINSALEFSVDTHIPGVGKVGFDAPDIPRIPSLDVGGRVLADGLAFIHRDEAVVPAKVAPLQPGTGANPIVVNVYGDTYGVDNLVEKVREELIRSARRFPRPLGGLA